MNTLTGERRDFDPRDAAEAEIVKFAECQWPIRSTYNPGAADYRTMSEPRTCGRGGARNTYQHLTLCWQHREAMFSEVVASLNYGGSTMADLAQIINAAVERLDRIESGEGDGFGDDYIDRLSGSLVEVLVRLTESANLSKRANEAIDGVVRRRLAATWGAA